MTRELLLNMVIHSLGTGNVSGFTSLLISNNVLAKTFDPVELNPIHNALKGSFSKFPDSFGYLKEAHIYKKNDMGALINEVPFTITIIKGHMRYFTSAKMQLQGFPDCIDVNTTTGELMGVELKNYRGRQYLPDLPHWAAKDQVTGKMYSWCLVNHFGRQNLPKLKRKSVNYAIITKPENVSFYRLQHPTSRVYTYSEFYHFRVHKDLYK